MSNTSISTRLFHRVRQRGRQLRNRIKKPKPDVYNPYKSEDMTAEVAFKLFGLQRCGTNLMRKLMLENFDVMSVEIGTEWKHGWVQEPFRLWNDQPIFFIVCVKHPLAWFLSCYKYFQRSKGRDITTPKNFNVNMSFQEFLRLPVYTFFDSVDRWNIVNRHWLTVLPEEKRFLVRNEDMLSLEGQVKVLKAIQQKFNLPAKQPLVGTEALITPGMSGKKEPMNFEFYREKKFLEVYQPEDFEWLRQKYWDDYLLETFDYERLWADPNLVK